MYGLSITDSLGKITEHKLGTGQTTIGSDKGSTISLPAGDGLLAQHILLVPSDEGCWVSTVPGAPLRSKDGEPVDGQYVPWNSQLSLGRLSFALKSKKVGRKGGRGRNQKGKTPDTGKESSNTISPVIVMALLFALVYLGSGLFGASETDVASISAAPPLLFDESVKCASGNSGHRAEQAEEAAFAKRQRSVFDLQDGIAAVELFSESEDCYRVAGRQEEAVAIQLEGTELRASLEAEYKLLRVRLQRALHSGNRAVASTQVNRLQELLHHRASHSYVLALRRLEIGLSRKAPN
ncbi:MAG: hypothetical protein JKY56_25455 [Kofleriaceae bacterium]|nr:hypothetical protein [Kofleriaceae bacterium]